MTVLHLTGEVEAHKIGLWHLFAPMKSHAPPLKSHIDPDPVTIQVGVGKSKFLAYQYEKYFSEVYC